MSPAPPPHVRAACHGRALRHIHDTLESHGKVPARYRLPSPPPLDAVPHDRLEREQLAFNTPQLRAQLPLMIAALNAGQRSAFDAVMAAVRSPAPQVPASPRLHSCCSLPFASRLPVPLH